MGLAGAMTLPLSSCAAFAFHKVRYTLAVDLLIGKQAHTVFNVMETQYYKDPLYHVFGSLGRPVFSKTYANAIELDLKSRGTLFALLGPTHGRNGFWADVPTRNIDVIRQLEARTKYKPDANRYDRYKIIQEHANFPEQRMVKEDFLPILLWMQNRDNLETARVLEPHNSQILDEEVTLMSARVANTESPINLGLEKRLPWWNNITFKEWRSSNPEFEGSSGLRRQNFVID